MEPKDITIEILKSIRDDVKGVRGELRDGLREVRLEIADGLREVRLEIAEIRTDVDVRIDRLHQRQVEAEVRLATELVAVTSAVLEVRDELRKDRSLRTRLDDHEHRIEALEKRTG